MTIAFSLDPPLRPLNFIDKTFTNQLTIKVMHYALWTLAFSSLGLALSSPAAPIVFPCYALFFTFLPIAIKVEQIFKEMRCKEFNQQLENVLGPLTHIPTITPKDNQLEKIRVHQMSEKWAKGMYNGHPFIAFKVITEDIEYIDCFYRDASYTWKSFNKVHAIKRTPLDLTAWKAWQARPSVIPNDQKLKIENFIQLNNS